MMIQLDNVTCYRQAGHQAVLDGITLTIPEGQWVSIAGPNGSGKSTLLKLMNGLLHPAKGEIIVNGIVLTSETLHAIRGQTGVVFQNPENQFVGQTVQDDIVFGLENLCLDRDTMHRRLHQYAEQLRVTHLLPRHPGTLSGGEMQRAALAAVLAMEPGVLLFDEATSMLDEAGRREFLDIMLELKASGRYTIVAATHDMDEMLASDRVVALSEGKIAADGAPMNILSDDTLLTRLCLVPPFAKRLAKALQTNGFDVGDDVWDEKELMKALWAYDTIT